MTRARRVFLRRIRQRKIGLKCYIFLCLLTEKFINFRSWIFNDRLKRRIFGNHLYFSQEPQISVPKEIKRDFIYKGWLDWIGFEPEIVWKDIETGLIIDGKLYGRKICDPEELVRFSR